MDNNNTLLDTIDQDDREALVSRRDAIMRGAKTSAVVKMALLSGSAPIALAALSREVYGQSTAANVQAVLQFAFLLENLEAEFYKTVLNANAAGQPAITATTNPQAAAFQPVRTALAAAPNSAAITASLQLIRDHEVAHVTLLRGLLTGTPPTYTGASFDFTGNRGAATGTGAFAAAATNLDFLLAVTQGFEDTGVRAYKGQAPALLRTAALQTALQIHSMEARHAARIRRIRRSRSTTTEVLRYSGTIRGGGAAAAGAPAGLSAAVTAAFEAIYGGASPESTATQATVPVATLPGSNANAATQAFDEPLTRAEVVAIVQPFVIATIPAA